MVPPPPDFPFNYPLPPIYYGPPIRPWYPPPPPSPSRNGRWVIVFLIIAFAASLFACAVKGYRNSRARAEAAASAAAAARREEWTRPRPPPIPRLESPRLHDEVQVVQLPRASAANPAARLPSFRYDRSVRHNVTGGGDEAATCSVCLAVFQLGERVRLLPACLHLYHAECIDPWLDTHSTCPICRSDADPTMDDARLPPV